MTDTLDTLRGNFAAEHKRPPTPAEAIALTEQARAEARAAEANRREAELKRAYMTQPDGSEEGWAKERATLLAADRAARVKAAQAEQRRAQSVLYRDF
jgi:hypothetical protein